MLVVIMAMILFVPGLLWQNYESKHYGFSISLPRLWVKIEGLYGTIILTKSPLEDKADRFQENINVVVTTAPVGMQTVTFFELFKNETLETVPGEEYGISEGEISSGSHRGNWLSFTSDGQDMSIKTLAVLWVKDGKAYIVTCTAQDIQFANYESTFKKAIRSFRIH